MTPEHPVAVGPEAGVFRMASGLAPGQPVRRWDGARWAEATLRSVRCVKADRPAYDLLVSPDGDFLAAGLLVHNKGCFLPDTPILRADGTEVPIRQVQPGDRLMAYTPEGGPAIATVREVLSTDVDEHIEVTTATVRLSVTAEHPFYVGDGTFKTLAALKVGDAIFVYDGVGLRQEPITSLTRVGGRTCVYNLRTDEPHTYFASGAAVHNKGGGCFAAGTLVRTPTGDVPIERLRPGDAVFAVDRLGRLRPTVVEMTYAARSRLLEIVTDGGTLRTTAEQPLQLADGRFLTAGEVVTSGQADLRGWGGEGVATVTIRTWRAVEAEEPIFNLQVGSPHTFIAGGLVVHNKGGGGGGGGGGGFHSGGSSGGSGGPVDWRVWLIVIASVAGFLIIRVVFNRLQGGGSGDGNLDFTFSQSDVAPKEVKTHKLIDLIEKQDPAFSHAALVQKARETFVKLQECWQSRDYTPMKPLLMPDLYLEHTTQIAAMVRDHEINRIDQLQVEWIDIVGLRYTHAADQREYTALITAMAMDYYVDDRTGARRRGDTEPEEFQEFWTFHFHGGAWLLREIDQTRESHVLREENFCEALTDQELQQAYAGAGGAGAAGPSVQPDVAGKEGRTERLLNFLVQTDKLWDRPAMIERARQVFMSVYAARELGDPDIAAAPLLFPEVAAHLQDELRRRQAAGMTVAFRNLCIRKVDLILVRNYADKSRDEFTVRITAHAQQVVCQGDRVVSEQAYVTPLEQYWTFGRLDDEWKLKEVEPPATGQGQVGQENVDEESAPGQMEWYYQHTRAN
jgi:predicted lipid-binding transport protein (Tim44 family)/uncharacterized membrane protein YgcG